MGFLISGKYTDFIDECGKTSLEYAITDLNSDTKPELLIQSSNGYDFYDTWTFVLDNEDIVLANKTYGYGSYRYFQNCNAVIVSPEFRPFGGTGCYPFYSLKDNCLEYQFQVGQDDGRYLYNDSNGTKDISDAERKSYFTDAVSFEWNQIQSLTRD